MTETEILAIVGLLYEGVATPASWVQAIDKLAAMTGSQAASFVLWHRPTNRAVVGEQVGLPDELVAAYAEHYHYLDPARSHIDRIPTGEWYLDERELGPAASIRRLPFYGDFLRRYALDSTMASPCFRSDEGMEGFLSLSAAAGRRDLAAVARSLAPLMPHIRRAAGLRLQLEGLASRASVQADALERLHVPLLVVSADGRVITANRLGAAWLAEPGNPLASRSRDAAAVLAILKTACATGPARRAAGTALRKRSGGEYYLTAVPLSDSHAGWAPLAPSALLLVNDPGQARPRSADVLRQVFRLTPAEIRLLEALQQGLSMKEACTRLQISPHTARTQLQSIFGKLGVRRQADLFRVLGQMDLVDHSTPDREPAGG